MRDFHFPGRSKVITANGMCATSHPLAAHTAVRMLEDGGNAVDAAIAAAAVLGLCEPQMTGLGGDCFVLLKPAGSEDIVALNGSGRAPAALNADTLRANGLATMPLHHAHAVTMPGAVDAFCRLSDDWGQMDLAANLGPAIHYAREGVPVAERTAFDWAEAQGTLSGAAQDFYLTNGNAPRTGQVFRHEQQAEVLEKIARRGRQGFYEGEVAEDMAAALKAAGGCHSLQDFNDVACEYTTPISGSYKGYELVEHPPNGQGATAILLAGILSHFDMAALDPFGAVRVHIEAEATKLAYYARDRFLADADHTTRVDHMMAPETAMQLAALIDLRAPMGSAKRASENVHKDTVYLTVVDKDRMAVSVIYSIYHAFGSGIASDKYGILFHNRGAGFTLEKGHPNEAVGGKRPMHTIIPGMLKRDGIVGTAFGVMGGAYQSTGHARFLSNLADYGMDEQEAIDAPRAFHTDGELRMERGYSDAVRQELADMGHKVVVPDGPIGGAQAIRIDRENGTLIGASDPRKDGAAIGY